ncbi:MAG: hypothetical protein ACFFCO_04725 [Promethearchaeota archaeon]
MSSVFASQGTRRVAAQVQDLEGVRVAVWGSLPQDSTTAFHALFEWMNAEVITVNSEDVRQGALDDVDIFAVPGVSEGGTVTLLQEEGCEAVRQFVRAGGSYFGVCGGSLVPLHESVHLYEGTITTGPSVETGIALRSMTVNQESTGPDLSEEPATYEVLLWASWAITAVNVPGYVEIATYTGTPYTGMIAYTYGSGNVFLSSPHPEFEEGDDRDGVTQFDEYNDPDSEWNFLLKIARWLVDSSPDETTPSGTTGAPIEILFLAGAVGISVVAVVAVVVLWRRRVA